MSESDIEYLLNECDEKSRKLEQLEATTKALKDHLSALTDQAAEYERHIADEMSEARALRLELHAMRGELLSREKAARAEKNRLEGEIREWAARCALLEGMVNEAIV
ncbi:hypothetical protein DFP72DRAFT_1077821 [Ephemerocybe angulata]|uniref:Uncharacterized protein n=1 Tax=Ephemerocybe angulata TaxID=980116 RepID=A0A8H6HDI4_9AGAR|nr:hypothetical protein DFP72DRAFT_1077821 [Tulosesus angulatus]